MLLKDSLLEVLSKPSQNNEDCLSLINIFNDILNFDQTTIDTVVCIIKDNLE